MAVTNPLDKPNPVAATAKAQVTSGHSGGRRGAPGAKEIPPFQWKIVGRSGDFILTLFKAVEREEVEAQLERLRRESYYKDLRILENDTVVPQPVQFRPKKVKKAKPLVKKAPKAPKASKVIRIKARHAPSAKRTIKSASASKTVSTAKASAAKSGAGTRPKRAKSSVRRLKKKA